MRKVERNIDPLPFGAKATYYFGTLDGKAGTQVWFIDEDKQVQTQTSSNDKPNMEFPIILCDKDEQKTLEEKLINESPIIEIWIADAGKSGKGFFGKR